MGRFKILVAFYFLIFAGVLSAQHASLKGRLSDSEGRGLEFGNMILFEAADSNVVKVELSGEEGDFRFDGLMPGRYFLKSSYVGYETGIKDQILLEPNTETDLGQLTLASSSALLAETVVSAKRSILEVKPDRTVFNVEGTINSMGSDAIALLRKAPGVTVDNNDNISVLGRSGVLIYIDGKRLPLSGQDLAAYLQNLQAEQIDRIEIISNPGAKYEAQGNAGILDIRLKKDKNYGTNGSINASYAQGRYPKINLSGNANYRNKNFNVFGNAGIGEWKGFHRMDFQSYQNDIFLNEFNEGINNRLYLNYRMGMDYTIKPQHTIGFLAGGNFSNADNRGLNQIEISSQNRIEHIDSILIANTWTDQQRPSQNYNLNYNYEQGQKRSLNIDIDYGYFDNGNERSQTNKYFDSEGQDVLSETASSFYTPSVIKIWTAKSDYESEWGKGKISLGLKYSQVNSDNRFRVFNDLNQQGSIDQRRSNYFDYSEKVAAAYLNYNRRINESWQYSGGIRIEHTNINGILTAMLPELQEPPVRSDYVDLFPSFGLNWNAQVNHRFQFNYGRRINRPDYHVLNPFVNQLSQLSYEKGNAFLAPEIVNNVDVNYTYAQQYNFKLAYSVTTDQITRLIGPDEQDPRAGFITWANLAEQRNFSFSASLPFQITKDISSYWNVSAAHLHNMADYGNGAIVDLSAFTYNFYQQLSFPMPLSWKAELSGNFSGPGIWGGVFVYKTSWNLDFGIQRKFLSNRLQLKISFSDIFLKSGWDGESNFDGLLSYGQGHWDSRRLNLNLSYKFGNDQVKSRKRQLGLEDEAGRAGSGD